MHQLHCRNGFTLVELLVVMAIISILASLLLPVLREARESANQVVCQGSLRQVGFVYREYADAFGSYGPPLCVSSKNWSEYVYQETGFVEDPNILLCPFWAPKKYSGRWQVYGMAYPNSSDPYYHTDTDPYQPGHIFFNFRRMTRMTVVPLLSESICLSPTHDTNKQYYYCPKGSGTPWHFRHRDQLNVVLGDLHTKACTRATVLELDGVPSDLAMYP